MLGITVKTDAVVKQFKAPAARLPLRADFPRIQKWTKKDDKNKKTNNADLVRTIQGQIEKTGRCWENGLSITLAYPHKRPEFFTGKPHRLVEQVYALRADLMQTAPQVKWVIADGLCEAKKLKRALNKNQTIEKALKRKHSFKYFPELQKEELPFANPENKEKEMFVLFDDIYCQGTTAANMIGFIEYNGGHVLAAIASEQPSHFPQRLTQQTAMNPGHFNNNAYNTGWIPTLATIFHRSAQYSERAANFSAEQCLDEVESVLNKWGYSLTTLTEGECHFIDPYINGYTRMFGGEVRGHDYDGFIRAFANGP